MREGKDSFSKVASGSMGGASTGMATSRGKTDGAIISGALENGGDETMMQFCVAVERRWRDFSGDVARIGGRGVGNDGTVVRENGGHHHLQHLQKRGEETTVPVAVAVKRGMLGEHRHGVEMSAIPEVLRRGSGHRMAITTRTPSTPAFRYSSSFRGVSLMISAVLTTDMLRFSLPPRTL